MFTKVCIELGVTYFVKQTAEAIEWRHYYITVKRLATINKFWIFIQINKKSYLKNLKKKKKVYDLVR